VTSPQVSKAKSERAQIQRELDQAVAAYDDAQAKLAVTQDLIDKAQLSLDAAEQRSKIVEGRLDIRADVIYRRGPIGILQFLLNAGTFSDFSRRVSLVRVAARRDSAELAAAASSKHKIAELQGQLADRKKGEAGLIDRMASQTKTLTAEFDKARALETKALSDQQAADKRDKELAAQAAIAAEKAKAAQAKPSPSPKPAAGITPVPSASVKPSPSASAAAKATPQPSPTAPAITGAAGSISILCPVDGPTSFTDTFGAPRSGGRVHEGIDLFAASGTPLVAVADGTLKKASSALGGISLYLKDVKGNEFYYAHMSGYAEVETGQSVKAGGKVGYVGNTGDALGGPSHLHFEVHPSTGGIIDPYPILVKACGK
jgi:peptidoglycan LD-endopeptidase LytH